MRKAGGIIAVIAGLLALGATFLRRMDFFIREFDFSNAFLFSSLAIVLGAILIGIGGRRARRGHPFPVLVLLAVGRRIPGLLLIAVAVQAVVLHELYNHEWGAVLLFLMLAAVGGVVSILPDFGGARRKDGA